MFCNGVEIFLAVRLTAIRDGPKQIISTNYGLGRGKRNRIQRSTTFALVLTRHQDFSYHTFLLLRWRRFSCWLAVAYTKCGFHGDVFVGNALITMYSRWEHLVDARQVFDEMRSRDWVSWRALITGYAQEGDHGLEAILVFNNGIQAISIKHGQRCHSHLIKVGLNFDPIISGTLLDLYAKRGSIQESQRVFNET